MVNTTREMAVIAARFESLRSAHQCETAEDYVEMIADLIAQQGEARIVDLASCMGVSPPTVNKIVGRLHKEGLVETRPYRSLHLTEQGQQLAQNCKKRHQIVYDFLLSLDVPAEVAQLDAEGIEHHVSSHTLKAFKNFINKGNQPSG